jgi:two-component system nitrate/nitrite response regulator NarL
MDTIAIAVVDTSRLFREGLRQLLEGSRFNIEAEAASAADVLRLAERSVHPKIILLDAGSDSGAFETIKQLRATFAQARIVVLTGQLSSQALAQALEAGADGYLLKDMSPAALAEFLDLVLIGEKVFPTQLATLLATQRLGPDRDLIQVAPLSAGLSEREAAILSCLVRGYPNKVIADRLRITEASVKVHLKSVLRKIHVSNRTQAAIWAINNGFQTDLFMRASD